MAMDFRPVTQDESVSLMELQARTFFFSFNRQKYIEEIAQNGTWRHGRGAFDEQGQLLAGLSLLPLDAWFDGSVVGLGGIGGVASCPEARHSGNVRGLMQAVLHEMADRGDVFSFLFPFSNEYYRKFGYESCHRVVRVRVQTELLRRFREPGHAVRFVPGEDGTDPTPIVEIYNDFAERHNLAIDREGWRWRSVLERDPFATRRHAYVWYGDDGAPGAYFVFKAGPEHAEANELHVMEAAWRTPEALRGMLGFISGFASNLKTFVWELPPSADLELLFPECKDYKIELFCHGMNRVVNASKALRLMKKPDGKGTVRILLTDETLPQNAGVYKVDWENGQSNVRKVKGGTADLECSTHALAQLVVGYLPLKQTLMRKDVVVNSKMDELEKLFIKKDVFTMDHF